LDNRKTLASRVVTKSARAASSMGRRAAAAGCLTMAVVLASACSTAHLGTPTSGIEHGRADGLSAVLAQRAERLDRAEQKAVAEVLRAAQREHQLDPFLLVALIEHESRWNARAVSSHRALGLMQVKAPVAKPIAHALEIEFDPATTLFDPVANVRIGVAYFAEMMDRFGNVDLALTAYNIGPNRTARILAGGGKPPVRFSQAVQARYQRIRAGAPQTAIQTAGL
jgi:soluble lytic murein transglycosylase